MNKPKGIVVWETEWKRIYRDSPNPDVIASKFLTDGLRISGEELRERWSGFAPAEKADFVDAWACKGVYDENDQEILSFVMSAGSDETWGLIATLLHRFRDRDRALSFLLERISVPSSRLPNYFQGLELLGDSRAIRTLDAWLDMFEAARPSIESMAPIELVPYLSCLRALWKLSSSPRYAETLKTFLNHQDPVVRRQTKRMLT